VLTGLVHSAAFGIDPLRSKGLAAVHVGEAKRAEEAVAHAEAMIEETLTAARRLGDSALADRVRALCSAARPVLAQIEEDPRDLVRARADLQRDAGDVAAQYLAIDREQKRGWREEHRPRPERGADRFHRRLGHLRARAAGAEIIAEALPGHGCACALGATAASAPLMPIALHDAVKIITNTIRPASLRHAPPFMSRPAFPLIPITHR
jgi:hypothetical protein